MTGSAALSIGKAVAGLNAQAKGRSLGIYKRAPGKAGAGASSHSSHTAESKAAKPKRGEDAWIEICNVPVPVRGGSRDRA